MIGSKFYKKNITQNDVFEDCQKAVDWCNFSQKGYIQDKGDYYEVCAVSEPTEEELAALALEQAKAERAAAVAAITVTVDGMVFDGDEVAQERMARTVTAATATGASMDDTTVWVLHDNTVATPTIRQLATALRMAGEAQTALWTKPYEA
jgi:biopolymer transport protein ExbD